MITQAKRNGGSALAVLLLGSLQRSDLTREDLASRLNISTNTLRKHLQNPEQADLKTLREIARLTQITKADFVEAWKW